MDHYVSLAIRTVVGLPLAYVAGFIGMITGGFLIPSIAGDDLLPILTRVFLIGLAVTVGVLATWLTFLLDWQKRSLLVAVVLAGGVTGGIIAFYWSDAFTGNSDLYIRVREITQSTVIGTVIGANLLALLLGFFAPRHWRS